MEVVFSGSSAIALANADLSRRALVYSVPILSFREFLELKLDIELKSISLEKLLNRHVQASFEIISKLNPNLFKILCFSSNIGSIRESFFLSMFYEHNSWYSKKGDYLIDNQHRFEIGGKNKSFKQIKDIEHSYLALDNMEIGDGKKIPLWLFGFLY